MFVNPTDCKEEPTVFCLIPSFHNLMQSSLTRCSTDVLAGCSQSSDRELHRLQHIQSMLGQKKLIEHNCKHFTITNIPV